MKTAHDYNFTLTLCLFSFLWIASLYMHALVHAARAILYLMPPPTPLLPPSPSYVISLPLGPWQTHQTGRKWSALLGRLSGLPPGFMANRQCLSLNWERQRGVGEGGGRVGGREGAEAQSRGTEWSKTSFAYRIVQTDMSHLWKMLTKLRHCEHLEHICRTNQCCWSCLWNLLWQLETNCTFFATLQKANAEE